MDPPVRSPSKKVLKEQAAQALERDRQQQIALDKKERDLAKKDQTIEHLSGKLFKEKKKTEKHKLELKESMARSRKRIRCLKEDKSKLYKDLLAQQKTSNDFVKGIMDHANSVMKEAIAIEDEAKATEARAVDAIAQEQSKQANALLLEKGKSTKKVQKERQHLSRAKAKMKEKNEGDIKRVREKHTDVIKSVMEEHTAALLQMKTKYENSQKRTAKQYAMIMKQLQKERKMWLVLDRNLNDSLDDVQLKVSGEKKRSRDIIRAQLDKAREKEKEMQQKINELEDEKFEMNVQLMIARRNVREQKKKLAFAKKISAKRLVSLRSSEARMTELKNELITINKLADKQKKLLAQFEASFTPENKARKLKKVRLKRQRGVQGGKCGLFS